MTPTTLADGARALRELISQGATGELICAGDEAEVHVHLQQGRIAWATTSVSRFAFARYVAQRCAIDAHALREIVQECRREQKPLGETLVQWGLAGEEDVREALRHQIREALATLPEGRVAAVFLRRGTGYSSYNRELTFSLDDVLPAPPRSVPAPRRPALSSIPPADRLGEALAELVAGGGIAWAEHYRGGKLIDREPGRDPRGLDALVEIFADGDIDFVVVRSERETVLGLQLSGRRGSVWCGLAPEATLGAVLAEVRERLDGYAPGRMSRPRAGLGASCLAHDAGIAPSALREMMERTEDLWGVAMHDASSFQWLAWREQLGRDAIAERMSAFTRALAVARALPIRPDELGLWQSSIVVSMALACFFGTTVLDGSERGLWLVLDPAAGHGLGWALLAALLRRTSLTAREVGR